MTTYNGYLVMIPTDPSYYGPDCSEADALRVVGNLREMVHRRFPGVRTDTYREIGPRSRRVTGPDYAVSEEIDRWIQEHYAEAFNISR